MAASRKVGNFTAGAMISVAVIIDGLQALLALTIVGSILGSVLAIISGFGFWLWFSILGVKYLGKGGGKKALIGMASVVAELVPLINALPATTAGVAGIIFTERANELKEKGGAPRGRDARKAAAVVRLARMKAARSQMLEAAHTAREAQRINSGSPNQET